MIRIWGIESNILAFDSRHSYSVVFYKDHVLGKVDTYELQVLVVPAYKINDVCDIQAN
jgi:hypothetical protein